MFVRHFPVLEFHDHHMRKFHSFARGRDSWQQIIPLCVVSETDDELVDNAVLPHCARDRSDRHVFGNLIYEMLAVKPSHALVPEAARHDCDAVHVRFRNHGFHGGIYILVRELTGDVPVEERSEIGRFCGRRPRRGHLCS